MAGLPPYLQVVSAIISLIAIGYAVFRFVQRVREDRDHHFSWARVDEATTSLVNDMKRKGFIPKTIIGTGRGGAVLAGLVADRLGARPRPRVFMIDREVQEIDGSKRVRVLSEIADFKRMPDEPVLIVAALVKSGRGTDAYKAWLHGHGLTNVKTAALVEAGGSGTHTHFCFKTLGMHARPAWFPWYKVLGQDPGE